MLKLSGFPRVDLTGGTLDIFPINILLEKVVTINLALELETKVSISGRNDSLISIESKNYNNKASVDFSDLGHHSFYKDGVFSEEQFKELSFVFSIVNHFEPQMGLDIILDANVPHGSGLGGSSTLGVSLFKALSNFFNKDFNKIDAIKIVQSYEALILNQGMPGYQDYYPSLFGGILALKSSIEGVKVEQLFNNELKKFLESNITLGFTGKNRSSGINNWGVYKNFFDKDQKTQTGLKKINQVSRKCYEAIQAKEYVNVLKSILEEGVLREEIFPTILTPEMKSLNKSLGGVMKVCGAGGGGCFILIGEEQEKYKLAIKEHDMSVLDFKIKRPLE